MEGTNKFSHFFRDLELYTLTVVELIFKNYLQTVWIITYLILVNIKETTIGIYYDDISLFRITKDIYISDIYDNHHYLECLLD